MIISTRSHAAQIECAHWVIEKRILYFVYIGSSFVWMFNGFIYLFIAKHVEWKWEQWILTKIENNKQNVRIQSENAMRQCQKHHHMQNATVLQHNILKQKMQIIRN